MAWLSLQRPRILCLLNLRITHLLSDTYPTHVSTELFSLVHRFVYKDFLAVIGADAVLLFGIVGDPGADVALPLSKFILWLLDAINLLQVDQLYLVCLFVQNHVEVLIPHFNASLPLVGVVDLLSDRATVVGVRVRLVAISGKGLHLRDLVAPCQIIVVPSPVFSKRNLGLDFRGSAVLLAFA